MEKVLKYGEDCLQPDEEEELEIKQSIKSCLEDIIEHRMFPGYFSWDEEHDCWTTELVSEKIDGVVIVATVYLEDME